jgi:hypothetical protein
LTTIKYIALIPQHMIHLSTLLTYYKREDIQRIMVAHAKDKEIAIRFNDQFGKRPDLLNYTRDVLEFAKQGATSFHASEELWSNAMQLNPLLQKSEIEALRKGWDLVIDIDCENWDISRVITYLTVQALKKTGIESISIKFSGNKGFHIGIPFEAFPEMIGGTPVSSLFPRAPRAIAFYILNIIEKEMIIISDDGNNIKFGPKNFTRQELETAIGKGFTDLIKRVCNDCGKEWKPKKVEVSLDCSNCGFSIVGEKDKLNLHQSCPKCHNRYMTLVRHKEQEEGSDSCNCQTTRGDLIGIRTHNVLNINALIKIDTLLISSRHLYRMPYSLHEKSGLVSLPIREADILTFDKKMALPSQVKADIIFIDRSKAKKNEGLPLIMNSLDFSQKMFMLLNSETFDKVNAPKKEYIIPEEAIPESCFPPCIIQLLSGVKDGRKRAVFILSNFLRSCGWDFDSIEKRMKEWNEKNEPPLKEVYIVGQLRYQKYQKKTILPPNCDNKAYYADMGIKCDASCRVKNPVNYARRRAGTPKGKKQQYLNTPPISPLASPTVFSR